MEIHYCDVCKKEIASTFGGNDYYEFKYGLGFGAKKKELCKKCYEQLIKHVSIFFE